MTMGRCTSFRWKAHSMRFSRGSCGAETGKVSLPKSDFLLINFNGHTLHLSGPIVSYKITTLLR